MQELYMQGRVTHFKTKRSRSNPVWVAAEEKWNALLESQIQQQTRKDELMSTFAALLLKMNSLTKMHLSHPPVRGFAEYSFSP